MALWVVQAVVAALFLFAGTMKCVMPMNALKLPVPISFLRFIGAAEILGAVGLVLPGLFKVARGLTPAAATGLVMIMTGATTITLQSGAVAAALVPLLVGVLAAMIAYGRRGSFGRAQQASRGHVDLPAPTFQPEGARR